MADISTYLAAILSAVYGEDVRGSIHDAIEIINDVSEVVLSTGTAVTGPTSSSTGFYDGSLYLNTNTYELWKCAGVDTWSSLGILKGDDGDPGLPGNKWYIGTGISGKAALPTVYSGSGIAEASVDDCYLNNVEGAVYHCVSGGIPTVATWIYDFTMSGGGGGDSVSWSQIVTTGTQIATININGTPIDVYAPTGGGGSSSLNDLTDVTISTPTDDQFLRYDGSKWINEAVTIPAAANDATLTITQNGSSQGTFTANASSNATIDIDTDAWFATSGTVSSGSVSFSGVDDSAGTNGYEVYFNITSSSTNKNPTAQISSISGEGTASMSISFTTDADNGAVAKLRIIK